MALNLVTPQYKPDVIGAAKAGEQITANMASTSLAERKLGEATRQYDEQMALKKEAQGESGQSTTGDGAQGTVVAIAGAGAE